MIMGRTVRQAGVVPSVLSVVVVRLLAPLVKSAGSPAQLALLWPVLLTTSTETAHEPRLLLNGNVSPLKLTLLPPGVAVTLEPLAQVLVALAGLATCRPAGSVSV